MSGKSSLEQFLGSGSCLGTTAHHVPNLSIFQERKHFSGLKNRPDSRGRKKHGNQTPQRIQDPSLCSEHRDVKGAVGATGRSGEPTLS